jgi:twinfilin-like protein
MVVTDLQEITASNPATIALLKSEACKPSEVASGLPPKSPCFTFYSYPTPAPAPSASASSTNASFSSRNTFQASAGGVRSVAPSADPKEGEEKAEGTEKSGEAPDVTDLKLQESPKEEAPPAAAAPAPSKGRVLFLYTCPSGSPIKFRMVYSSSVRGIQQEAKDRCGVEISSKARSLPLPAMILR